VADQEDLEAMSADDHLFRLRSRRAVREVPAPPSDDERANENVARTTPEALPAEAWFERLQRGRR
jgi:hypothetical protein